MSRRAVSFVAGALVAAIVAALGAAVLLARPPAWRAGGSLLVLPSPATTDPDLLAGLYDALSRGQVPATYAELLRDRRFEADVARERGLAPNEVEQLRLDVEVVPVTSVLDLRVTAPRASLAEEVADDVLTRAESYLSALESPYGVRRVGETAGTAERTGLNPLPLSAVVAVIALLAGMAAQQAVVMWARAGDTQAHHPRPVPRASAAPVSPAAPSASPRAG